MFVASLKLRVNIILGAIDQIFSPGYGFQVLFAKGIQNKKKIYKSPLD